MAVSLVTGATGFLGAALVGHLLARGQVVRCVVRGSSDIDRTAKLRAVIGPAERHRIEVVAGDLSKATLGLSPNAFTALGHDVTRVYHCGARVNLTLPYVSLYDANVRATEDLLRLAELSTATFTYVGSIAAVAKHVVHEPFELTAPVTGGYPQTKWSADRLVAVAHQEGRVRAAIMRPGRVTADSSTARSNPDDLLERVLRICVRLGAAPVLDTRVRLSPVDWVSHLIVALTEAGASCGRAYHLVAEETLSWARVVEIVRGAGYPLGAVPYPRWRSMAVHAGRENPDVARVASSLPQDTLVFDDRPTMRPANARTRLADGYPALPAAEALLKHTILAWRL